MKQKGCSIDIVMLDDDEFEDERTSQSSFDLFEVDGYLVNMDEQQVKNDTTKQQQVNFLEMFDTNLEDHRNTI